LSFPQKFTKKAYFFAKLMLKVLIFWVKVNSNEMLPKIFFRGRINKGLVIIIISKNYAKIN
jgi:hypothetical protein